MNAKSWVPLAVALALGTAAALMARHSLRKNAAAERQQTVSVVVAKVPIAPGESLTAEHLATVQIAGKLPPPQGFTNPAELVGRVAAAPLLEGQPFLRSLLAPKGALPGLQALVPAGLRAVTVDVSESGGVAGLLTPGSHVDVVATTVNRDNQDKTITRTIVQNLTVVAVGQRLAAGRPDGDKDNAAAARTVTLLASPHDAEALDLVLTTSRVRLVLRASNDADAMADDGVMLAELRSGDAYQPPAPVVIPTVDPRPLVTPPTTQPGIFTKAQDPPSGRVVTVILGAEEHHVIFAEPRPDPNRPVLTDNPSQPAIPQ